MRFITEGARWLIVSALFVGVGYGIDYATHWKSTDVVVDGPLQVFTPVGPVSGPVVSPVRISTTEVESTWRVAFVTNRVLPDASPEPTPITEQFDANSGIAGQVGGVLTFNSDPIFGFRDVYVPRDRERGSCRYDPEDPSCVECGEAEYVEPPEFYEQVAELAGSAKSKDVLVYVHGFNVSFDESIGRAAQIAEDMPFGGVIVAFSWPSRGRTRDYGRDGHVSESYFWTLADVLADLRTHLGDDVNLHVLAHSMGNRVVLRALNTLAGVVSPTTRSSLTGGRFGYINPGARFPNWGAWGKDRISGPPIDQLVFAAPDVEARRFAWFVENVRHTAKGMTLYASDSDVTMAASRKYNGGARRAGDSRARIELPYLRRICVSGVTRLDRLGHSYYGSSPVVLSQLSGLFRSRRATGSPGGKFIGSPLRTADGSSSTLRR